MRKYKCAVVNGRFQPFHKAHLEIIQLALEEADTVIIAIGSCNKPITITNPWCAAERIDLIRAAIKAENTAPWSNSKMETDLHRIRFVEVRDYFYNNSKWAAEIYTKALQSGATSDKDTALYACYKDKGSFWIDMFPQWDKRLFDYLYNLDATDIRKAMYETGNINAWQDRLPTYIWHELHKFMVSERGIDLAAEHNFYEKEKEPYKHLKYGYILTTVDCVVVKSGHILLIERGSRPGKGLVALPGGFLEQDERIVDGAIRELKEETTLDVDIAVLKRSIIETRPFDHEHRSFRGRMITHAHLIDLGETGQLPRVKARSDAKKAFWEPMADVLASEKKFFDDHYSIIVSLTSRF